MLEDGCLGSTDAAACRAVYNGAMVHGVESALQAYATLVLEVLAMRRMGASAKFDLTLHLDQPPIL